MTNEEIAVKLAEVEERGKSNTHRLDEIDEKLDDLHRLVAAVEVISVEQKHINQNLTEMRGDMSVLKSKVDEIERKPAKKWEDLAAKVVWALVAAAITFILAKVGLNG